MKLQDCTYTLKKSICQQKNEKNLSELNFFFITLKYNEKRDETTKGVSRVKLIFNKNIAKFCKKRYIIGYDREKRTYFKRCRCRF